MMPIQVSSPLMCPICWDLLVYPICSACLHSFCLQCFHEYLLLSHFCPVCHENLHQNPLTSIPILYNLADLIEELLQEETTAKEEYERRKEDADMYIRDRKIQKGDEEVDYYESGWKKGAIRRIQGKFAIIADRKKYLHKIQVTHLVAKSGFYTSTQRQRRREEIRRIKDQKQ